MLSGRCCHESRYDFHNKEMSQADCQTVFAHTQYINGQALLTSMKSALAGMYPAMSRDSKESKVGLGGSSEAGMLTN